MAGQARANRAIDESRPFGARPRFPPGHRDPPTTGDPAAEPEGDGLVAAELRQEVGNALDGLPGEQRAVLEMAYYEGYSQREISEKTGLPLGTVKTRTRLALRKLREVLDPTLKRRVEGPDGVR